MQIILYSNHCPNCRMLKALLDKKNIQYTEINNIDDILARGLTGIPYLEIGNELMDYEKAKKWVMSYNN